MVRWYHRLLWAIYPVWLGTWIQNHFGLIMATIYDYNEDGSSSNIMTEFYFGAVENCPGKYGVNEQP